MSNESSSPTAEEPQQQSLAELAAEITALGERIKTLKSGTVVVDPSAVPTAVAALLDAKKRYAERNNGIGVDGQPVAAAVAVENGGGATSSSSGKQVRCWGVAISLRSVWVKPVVVVEGRGRLGTGLTYAPFFLMTHLIIILCSHTTHIHYYTF